jgi:hypothetical protein
MGKKIVLVLLVLAVIGMAHLIEVSARPTTGKQGVRVEGGHEH